MDMKTKNVSTAIIVCVSVLLLSSSALVSASGQQHMADKNGNTNTSFDFMPWVCQFCGHYNNSVKMIVTHHEQFTSLSYEQYYLGPSNYSFSRFGLISPKQLAARYDLSVFPMIVSSDKAAMHVLFTNSALQTSFINDAVKTAKMRGYAGYNMDFEVPYYSDSTALTSFIANFSAALAGAGLSLSVDLPGTAVLEHFSPTSYGGAYNWSAISKTDVSKLIVMDYVSIGDFEQIVNYSVANIPLSKLSIALPDYGFGFLVNTTTPKQFPYNIIKTVGAHMYGQVKAIVHDALLQHAKVTKHFSAFYGEAYYEIVYPGENGTAYEYYYINSHAMQLRLNYLEQHGIRAIAMWRLGSVDNSIWGPLQDYASWASATVVNTPIASEKQE
ncbi:MAG: hypothetical protein M1117_05765 [Candidatus Thermoplasmatota archaeon]|nr:hypothetical protein [Candidatus Thermoplasmatota archaeon]